MFTLATKDENNVIFRRRLDRHTMQLLSNALIMAPHCMNLKDIMLDKKCRLKRRCTVGAIGTDSEDTQNSAADQNECRCVWSVHQHTRVFQASAHTCGPSISTHVWSEHQHTCVVRASVHVCGQSGKCQHPLWGGGRGRGTEFSCHLFCESSEERG